MFNQLILSTTDDYGVLRTAVLQMILKDQLICYNVMLVNYLYFFAHWLSISTSVFTYDLMKSAVSFM